MYCQADFQRRRKQKRYRFLDVEAEVDDEDEEDEEADDYGDGEIAHPRLLQLDSS